MRKLTVWVNYACHRWRVAELDLHRELGLLLGLLNWIVQQYHFQNKLDLRITSILLLWWGEKNVYNTNTPPQLCPPRAKKKLSCSAEDRERDRGPWRCGNREQGSSGGLWELGGEAEMFNRDFSLSNVEEKLLSKFSVKLPIHWSLKCGLDIGGLSQAPRLKPGQSRGCLLRPARLGDSSGKKCRAFHPLCSGQCPGQKAYKDN